MVQIAEAATLNFSPLALSYGFHHSPTALPPPVGAAAFRRATPRFPPQGSCIWGAQWCLGKDPRSWHTNTVLFLLLIAKVACAHAAAGAGEQRVGWQSRGGWYRSSQLWDMRLSLVAAETGVQVQQRERSHSEIACIVLNSFIAWCLPFILPPGLCVHCWHSLPILYNNSQLSASHCLPMEPTVTGPPARSHEKLHAKV